MSNAPVVPVLDLLHPDLVDADGKLMNGPPRPGLFAARTSIPLEMVIHVNDDDGHKLQTDPEFRADWVKNVSPSLSKLFDRLLRAVSQRDIGADLLSFAHRQKVIVGFDAESLSKGPLKGTHQPGFITLDQTVDFGALVISFVHELEHEAHGSGGLNRTPQDSFGAYLKKDRLAEAAATAATAVFVYQAPKAPNWDGGQEILLQAFEKYDPYMARAAKKFSHLVRDENWLEFSKAMLQEASLNLGRASVYDAQLLEKQLKLSQRIDDARGDPESKSEWRADNVMSQLSASNADLASAVQYMGKTYVNPKILSAPEFTQLVPNENTYSLYQKASERAVELNKKFGLAIDLNVPRPCFTLMARMLEYNRQIYLQYAGNSGDCILPDVPACNAPMAARYAAALVKHKISSLRTKL